MISSTVLCSKCHSPLVDFPFNHGGLAPCPRCGSQLEVQIFPAFFKRLAPGRQAELVVDESESSCFYHPQKRAVLPCDSCGRFLCALCDCELKGQHYCPSCLEAGKTKGKIKNLEKQRVLYDNIALALAVYPILFICTYYLTVFTAPVAIFVAIRYWNKPTSIVRRTRFRHILALIIATLQLISWAFFILALKRDRMT